MAVETYNPTDQAVTVTPDALAHFKRQLAGSDDAQAVRLSVKESGCTGFMYVVDMVQSGQPDDVHYELEDGVELFIDNGSLNVVSGTQIDYVKDGVNRQLKFNNPRASDHCGCGESFNIIQD